MSENEPAAETRGSEAAPDFPELIPADAPAEPARRPRRRFRAVMWLLGLGVVAGAGFALAWYDPLKLRPDSALAPLQAQVGEFASRLETQGAALQDLQGKLEALEAAAAEAAEAKAQVAAVAERIGGMEARLDEIAAAPVDASGGISAASYAALQGSVAALKADVEALKGTAGVSAGAIGEAVDKAMQDWTARAAAEAEAAVTAAKAAAAQVDAVQGLRAALVSGAPYAEVLTPLEGQGVADLLRQNAAAGLPTLAQLAGEFPDLARAALDASRRAEDGGSLTERLWGFLRIQTGARSLEPREGTDPDAILSRAEAKVAAGDLAGALAELEAMPAEGAAALAGWVERTKLHLAAEAAIADLAKKLGL